MCRVPEAPTSKSERIQAINLDKSMIRLPSSIGAFHTNKPSISQGNYFASPELEAS